MANKSAKKMAGTTAKKHPARKASPKSAAERPARKVAPKRPVKAAARERDPQADAGEVWTADSADAGNQVTKNFPEIEQYEKKIYDLTQLIEISKGLNSTLDYPTLIDSILLVCMGQLKLLNVGIFLKKNIGAATFTLHRDYKGFELDHTRDFEISQDAAVLKLMEQEPVCHTLESLVADVRADDAGLEVLRVINPALTVPLVCKKELQGVLVLGDRIDTGAVTYSEKEHLMAIASLAGIAIHNAMLFEMATMDMMTKLRIHHVFQTSLKNEMQRSVRLALPLCLLMMDIDHFKNFNDSYGHPVGDAVIINTARIIKENTRPMDVAARYGGEEFALMLTETRRDKAEVVAERIRKAVRDSLVRDNDLKLSVTISIGVTQFDPVNDTDKQSFIERADKALYMAKTRGRNCVMVM